MENIKLRCSLQVVRRDSLTDVVTLSLGCVDSVRKMESIRKMLAAANPSLLFLADYKEDFENLDDVCEALAKNNDIEV